MLYTPVIALLVAVLTLLSVCYYCCPQHNVTQQSWKSRVAVAEAEAERLQEKRERDGHAPPRRVISDIARSDYEQDQMLKELMAQEAMKKRCVYAPMYIVDMCSV
jgi:hypothetical protein